MKKKVEKKGLSRRDFLKKAALGTAALSVGGSIGKAVFAQTKTPIKIGVAISLTGAWAREGELEVGDINSGGRSLMRRDVHLVKWRNLDVEAPDFLEGKSNSSSMTIRAIPVRLSN